MRTAFYVDRERLEELCNRRSWYFGSDIVFSEHPVDLEDVIDIAEQIENRTDARYLDDFGDVAVGIAEDILNWACDIVIMYS